MNGHQNGEPPSSPHSGEENHKKRDATSTTTTDDEPPPRKRSRRMLPSSVNWEPRNTGSPKSKGSSKSSKKKSSSNSTTTQEQRDKNGHDMSWICVECKEAECMIQPEAREFLICDGKCNRLFHYPCAGLNELPPTDQDWFCKDCTNRRHPCSLCQEYGTDDEDVFLCSKPQCGLFFHESCLSMHNVDIVSRVKKESCGSSSGSNAVQGNGHTSNAITTPTTGSDTATSSVVASTTTLEHGGGVGGEHNIDAAPTSPVFTCPAHWCWTCTQTIHEKEEVEEEQGATTATPSPSSSQGKGRPPKKQGRKNQKKKPSIQKLYFQCKSNSRLFRCLECPRSYHITCMPPSARFHELAVLCHEHAATHKLPELDMATSIQGSVEDRIDKRMFRIEHRKVKGPMNNRGEERYSSNRFFHGMRGDRLVSEEKCLLDSLSTMAAKEGGGEETAQQKAEESAKGDADLRFCLPCDLKDEVHSKPPSYKHIHSLRYQAKHRPKKIPRGEACHCKKSCDEDCLNRASMVECFSDGNASNCQVGDKCGNRSIGRRLYAKCKPQREVGKGWGLVAVDGVKRGMLVQEYMGEVIDERSKEQRLDEWTKEHPNDPNFYIMALPAGWYIDARHEANLSRFINHSCDPNCKLETINVRGYMRVGIFSLRDIAPGEFLSYDYHFDTKHGDKFLCRCGAKKCRGTMKGGEKALTAELGNISKATTWKDAKTKLDADRRFLDEIEGSDTKSLVDVLVPAAEQPTETVAAGPQDRYRDVAQRNRLFLWRNANAGADFANRFAILDSKAEARKSTQKPN